MLAPRRPAAVATALLLLLTAGAAGAQAAPPAYDIRGTWQGVAGSGVSGTVTWETEDCATGAISGRGADSADTWPAAGTIDGAQVTITIGPFTKDPTYSATGVGRFVDANRITGTFRDSDAYKDQAGTFEFVRTSGPPQDGQGCGTSQRVTATTVACNYSVATGANTCTATVADAGAPPRTTPTGDVAFTSRSGGVFSAGDSCALQPTPLSPGVASCSVQWLPPTTDFPNITASYRGDRDHAPSAGDTTFVIPASIVGIDDDGVTTGTCTTSSEAGAASLGTPFAGATEKKTFGEKLCSLTALGAAGYIAYLTCTSTVVVSATGQVEIAWVPAVACVVSLIAAGVSLDYLTDPPAPTYRDLALPGSPPAGDARVVRTCRSKTKGLCTRLRGAFRDYHRALAVFAAAQGDLGRTGNRLTGAREAKDAGAILLQVAARKLYAGRLADASATLNRRARALRAALRRAGVDLVMTDEQLAARRRALERRPPKQVRGLLGELGISVSDFNRSLRSAVDRVVGSRQRPSFVDALRRPYPFSAYAKDYRSMTLDNLRALVRGLGRRGRIAARPADLLLSDLACVPGHPAPDVRAFIRHTRTAVPKGYAALLRDAAAPLQRTRACR